MERKNSGRYAASHPVLRCQISIIASVTIKLAVCSETVERGKGSFGRGLQNVEMLQLGNSALRNVTAIFLQSFENLLSYYNESEFRHQRQLSPNDIILPYALVVRVYLRPVSMFCYLTVVTIGSLFYLSIERGGCFFSK